MEIDYDDQSPDWLVSGKSPPAHLWAEHFQRPAKQKNVLYTKYFEERLALCKYKYVFLTDKQVYGVTLNELNIPTLGARIKQSFLKTYKSSCKKQNKDVSRSELYKARRRCRLFEENFDDSSSTKYDVYSFTEENENTIGTYGFFECDVYDNLSEMFQSVAIQPYKSLPRKARQFSHFNQNYSRKSFANLKDNKLLNQFKNFKDLTEVDDGAKGQKSILKRTLNKKRSSKKSVEIHDNLETIFDFTRCENNEGSTLNNCSSVTSSNNFFDLYYNHYSSSIDLSPTLEPVIKITAGTCVNRKKSIEITLQTDQPTKTTSIESNEIDTRNSHQTEVSEPSTKDNSLPNETSENESLQSQQDNGFYQEFICNSIEESNSSKTLLIPLRSECNIKHSIESETNIAQKDSFLRSSPDTEPFDQGQLDNLYNELNMLQSNDFFNESNVPVVDEFETTPQGGSFVCDSEEQGIFPGNDQSSLFLETLDQGQLENLYSGFNNILYNDIFHDTYVSGVNEFETVLQGGSFMCDSEVPGIFPYKEQSQTVDVPNRSNTDQVIEIIHEGRSLEEEGENPTPKDDDLICDAQCKENMQKKQFEGEADNKWRSQEDINPFHKSSDQYHDQWGLCTSENNLLESRVENQLTKINDQNVDIPIMQSQSESAYKNDGIFEFLEQSSLELLDEIPDDFEELLQDGDPFSLDSADNMIHKDRHENTNDVRLQSTREQSKVEKEEKNLMSTVKQCREEKTYSNEENCNKIIKTDRESYFKRIEIHIMKKQQTDKEISSQEFDLQAKEKKIKYQKSIDIPIRTRSKRFHSCKSQEKKNLIPHNESVDIPIRGKAESDHYLDKSEEFHSFESLTNFSNNGNEDCSGKFSFQYRTAKFDKEDNEGNNRTFEKIHCNSPIHGTSIHNINFNRLENFNENNDTEKFSSQSYNISCTSYGEDENYPENDEATTNYDHSPNTALNRFGNSDELSLDFSTLKASSPVMSDDYLTLEDDSSELLFDADVSMQSESQNGYSKSRARTFGDELDPQFSNKISVDENKSDEESLSSTLELAINRKRKAMDDSVVTVPVPNRKLKKQKQSNMKSCSKSQPIEPVPSTSSFNKSLNNQFNKNFKPNALGSTDSQNNFEERITSPDLLSWIKSDSEEDVISSIEY